MNNQDIARQRLWNQRLSGPPLDTLTDVVSWLGAIQSQEYAVAKWSIGQRAKDLGDAALDQALADGTILRTHVLRPTWHFVLPADIRWMTELTAPRVHALNAYWYRKFGVDDALVARSQAVLAARLAGGHQLTRKDLAALLAAHGMPADGLRLGYLLMRAELDMVICSGGLKGKQHSYALFDERVPQTSSSRSRDEALAELTTRYFTSRGPATVQDYVWWSSLTVADARRGLAMTKPQLERIVIADRTYWYAPSPSAPAVSPTAHLLQGYDEYIVAYTESKDVLDVAGVAGVVPGGEPMFTHAIVLDGQVVGHWRRVVRANAVTIGVQLVTPLDADEREALTAAVRRYGTFIGIPATW